MIRRFFFFRVQKMSTQYVWKELSPKCRADRLLLKWGVHEEFYRQSAHPSILAMRTEMKSKASSDSEGLYDKIQYRKMLNDFDLGVCRRMFPISSEPLLIKEGGVEILVLPKVAKSTREKKPVEGLKVDLVNRKVWYRVDPDPICEPGSKAKTYAAHASKAWVLQQMTDQEVNNINVKIKKLEQKLEQEIEALKDVVRENKEASMDRFKDIAKSLRRQGAVTRSLRKKIDELKETARSVIELSSDDSYEWGGFEY